MGYTDFTVRLLEKVIKEYEPTSVLDLGAQNLYNQPVLPAPYASTWYEAKRIIYVSVDLNGENNSIQMDLGKPLSGELATSWVDFEMVVDSGTSEHIGTNGAFDWEAIYNCWKTKHDLLKIGGLMVNENPKTQNWPAHSFQYYTEAFYKELAALTDYQILELGEHPACGNFVDGWNVYCVLRKHSERFPTLDEFKLLSLYQK
jgi:hypothetical protein